MSVTLGDGLFGPGETEGDLFVPPGARGVVLIPHGSGISRGPGDSFVAQKLYESGLATMLVDLLTAEEQELDSRIACFRFDITLLAGRLASATAWLADEQAIHGLPVGYFAGSSSAAAALVVSASQPGTIAAIVSHSGRPDLAEPVLNGVTASVLLLVDGADESLIRLNRDHLDQIGGEHKQFVLVPSVASPFEDSSAPEEAARLAVEWFTEHLHRAGASEPKQCQSAGWPAPAKQVARTDPGKRSAEHGGLGG